MDERGNVIGVVSVKLSARAALSTTGALPENVNYAVKNSYLLSFLESAPGVSAKLKGPETKEGKFEGMMKSAEQAAVLVLVFRAKWWWLFQFRRGDSFADNPDHNSKTTVSRGIVRDVSAPFKRGQPPRLIRQVRRRFM